MKLTRQALLFALCANLCGCGQVLGFDQDYQPETQLGPRSRLPVGNRIPWNGTDWFLFGASVPWYSWSTDFGGGTADGVSNAATSGDLAARFATATAAGLHLMRWYVFPDQPWQLGAPGQPWVSDTVFADIDAALALAEQRDLYYELALFSARRFPDSWLSEPATRSAFLQQLSRLFKRYADHPRIVAWEIFSDLTEQTPELRDLIGDVAGLIQAHTRAYASVGMEGQTDPLDFAGQGLDYLVVADCADCGDYSDLVKRGADTPIVFTTFAPPSVAAETFDAVYQHGYAGVLVWSVCSDKTADMTAIDYSATTAFSVKYPNVGPVSR